MIAAQKSRWFTWLFARHARARIARTFGRVLVSGVDDARTALERGPVLVVANHTTWWDALVALWLSEIVLGADGWALMDAKNLRRVPFFARVGAFGADLDDARDGARAIRHSAKLLDGTRPRRLVWIFPEGRERSPFEPLELRAGAAQMARVAKRAAVVPVALRYVFGARERPDLFVHVGAPRAAERQVEAGVAQQRRGLEEGLAAIDRAIAGARTDFEPVLEHAPGPLASAAERALALLFPV